MSAQHSAPRRAVAVSVLLCLLLAVVQVPAEATTGPAGPDLELSHLDLSRPDLLNRDLSDRNPWDLGRSRARPDGSGDSMIAGELIVTFAESRGTTAADGGTRSADLASRVLGARSASVLGDRVELVRTVPGTEAAVSAALARRTDIIAVEPNVRREFQAVPDDPSYSLQWAHQQTNVEQAWDIFTGGASVGESRPLVAILDSGADATHPDLADIIVSSVQTVDDAVVPGPADNDQCKLGHGTPVSGVTGAQGNNGYGIAGVLWMPRLIDVSLTNPGNGCPSGPSDADAITAINYIVGLEEKPLVMNLSFGGSADECTVGYQTAVDAAREAGILIVSSAGNSGRTAPMIPASCDGVVSVAATDRNENRAGYSQMNAYLDLTGPGGFQPQTCPEDLATLAEEEVVLLSLTQPKQYTFGPNCRPQFADANGHRLEAAAGTSFSTPYVAGAVALLRQYALDHGFSLSPDQVEALIEATARDRGEPGRDDSYGWGVLDVGAAMTRLVAGDLPPLQPDPPFPVAGEVSLDALRVADQDELDTTDPIRQAIAVSHVIGDAGTSYVVLARSDDFADALSGSAVGFGIGPLLYTEPTGPLNPLTKVEIARVLNFDDAQPPIVFIMGGPAAVPRAVDAELEAMDVRVQRLAGTGREATAVAASQAVEQLKVQATGTITRNHVFVASGRAFPDAVSAGQMAAYYGIPVLVTNPDGLHPDVAAEIARLAPDQVWVVGGTSAISTATFGDVQALGFPTSRLSGDTRIGTALAIFEQFTAELALDGSGALEEAITLAVNLRFSYHDVLSATFLAGQGNWFFPLEGEDGSLITPAARSTFCGFRGDLRVIGGRDRIIDATVEDLSEVLAGRNC